LDHVSFKVGQGEIFGVLGPNGGGKTTLFRILSTLLHPSQGHVRIAGHDVGTQPQLVRRQLGIVFQMPSLDVKLSAWENLQHQGHLYGLQGSDLRQRIGRLLETVGLSGQRNERVESFSGGMRRRVELAKALLHDPPLLLLDEPSTGLDVAARRDLWRHLETLCSDQGTTVVLTTHLMDEADRCDRLAILSEGQLVAIDTPGSLKARIGGDIITIETASEHTDGLCQDVTARFGPWPDGTGPTVIDDKLRLEKTDGAGFVATLTEAFSDKINSITVGRPTLEDVFMNLTGRVL
jgi:ABC-2 type transport system ATP-binding protein